MPLHQCGKACLTADATKDFERLRLQRFEAQPQKIYQNTVPERQAFPHWGAAKPQPSEGDLVLKPNVRCPATAFCQLDLGHLISVYERLPLRIVVPEAIGISAVPVTLEFIFTITQE